MKQSRRYTALALVALTSALLLGACGGNKQDATTASSSTKTSQSSKMSNSSSKAKTEKKAQSASSEEMKVESSSSQESQSAKQENKQEVSKEDTSAKTETTQGTSEFTKFAGTWTNDEGETIVINPDGTTTAGEKLENAQEHDNGVYTAGIRSKEGFGASFFYAPAGQAFPDSMAPKEFVNTDGTDISRERIVIAQSVDRMAHPFYRTE